MKNIHDDLSSLDLGIYEARDLVQNRTFLRLMSLHSATHSQWCMLLLDWLATSSTESACCYCCSMVTLYAMSMSCAKPAEPVEMLFTIWTWVCPRNHVLYGLLSPLQRGHIWGIMLDRRYAKTFLRSIFSYLIHLYSRGPCLQCFYAVGWAAGRASGL